MHTPKSLIILSAGILCTALPLSAQTIVQDWQFNDAAATSLTGLSNSAVGGGNSFDANLAGVETNSSGLLTIDNDGSIANSWLDTTDLSYTSGQYLIEANIASWNLNTNNGNSGLYIGFMDGNNNTTVTADFNITSNGTNMILASRIGDTTRSGDTNFALSGSDLTIRVLVDLDAGATGEATTSYDLGSTGTFTTIVSGESLNTRDLVDFRFRQSADWSGASDSVSMDYLTITAVPEPSAFAALAGLLALGFVTVRRRR